MLQRVRPFISTEDIRKGARWQQDIAQQLATVKYAIVCLTSENISAPWIHFEAGAVSKHIEAAHVTSLLIDLEPKHLDGPLTQFQNTQLTKGEIRKLIFDMNAELGADALQESQLATTFDMFWPRLDERLGAARKTQPTTARPTRSTPEMLDEILEISRSTSRVVSTLVAVEEKLVAAYESGLLRPPAPFFQSAVERALQGQGFQSKGIGDLLARYANESTPDSNANRSRIVNALLDLPMRAQSPQEAEKPVAAVPAAATAAKPVDASSTPRKPKGDSKL